MTMDEETAAVLEGVNMVWDIDQFHQKFHLKYDGRPRQLPEDIGEFRINFMKEELLEYIEASLKVDLAIAEKDDAAITEQLEKMLDALVDLVYVALGTSYLHGFDFMTAWYRVQKANMAKVRAKSSAESKRNSTWDVVKPEGWVAPSHTDLVEDHAHRQLELDL